MSRTRSRTAVGGGAAALLLSAVLPWVQWGRGGHAAAPSDAVRVEVTVLVGGDLASRTVLHPLYLPALVGGAAALLALVALRPWDRRNRLAAALAGSPALAAAAASLRAVTDETAMLVETPAARVPTTEIAPGIGLLLGALGAALAVGGGIGGLAVGTVPPETRTRIRERVDRVADRFGGERRIAPLHAVLALAIGVALWYHVQFLGLALGRDAGAYLTVAAEILRGRLPYVHVFDHKPPGVYYYLAAVLGAGGSVGAARAGILLVNVGVAGLLVLLGRALWDRTAGLVAAFGYLLAAPLYQGYMIQTEQFVALFSLAALAVALPYREAARPGRLALAGALAGLATLFKHPGIATLGALGLFALVASPRTGSPIRDRAAALAALCGGFALPVALVTAYFALLGGLGPFLRWTVLLNAGYLGGTTQPAANLAAQYETMLVVWPVWVLAGAGLVLALGDWAAPGRPDPGQVLVVAAAVSALAVVLVRPWPHYLLHPLPLAALLAGYAVYVIADDLPVDPRRAKTALVVGLVLSAGVAVPHLEEQRARNDGLARQQAIAADVESHLGTGTGNSLLVFPASPLYYYLTGSEPHGENIYYLRSNRGVSYTQASIVELVKRRPPDYVLVREWECEHLPAACSYLKSRSERVQTYPDRGLALYRLNATASG